MALPRKSLETFQLAFDDINQLSTTYLITWNPKPKFYQSSINDVHINYDLQWWTMLSILKEANRCCSQFAFVPEISIEGKLHMHGWFTLKDMVKFHKSFLPSLKRNGFVKMNQARSIKWKTFKYHIKDLYDTHQHLYTHDIVVTHHNIQNIREEYTLKYVLDSNNYDKKIKKGDVISMLLESVKNN